LLCVGGMVAFRVPVTKPADVAPSSRAPPRRIPYSDGAFMAFVLVSFVMATVFGQGFAPLPLDMASHGVTARDFGLLIAINGAIVVLAQPVATEIVAKRKPMSM